MNKVVVFERADGTVAIMSFPELDADTIDDHIQSEIDRFYANFPGEYVSHKIKDRSEVPEDRTFRNALKSDLTFDMAKARDIHRDRLRELRKPMLAALDVEYQRADEAGDKEAKRTIAAKKQALRDVTVDPTLETADTPEALKEVLPEILRKDT